MTAIRKQKIDSSVQFIAQCLLPTLKGNFQVRAYRNLGDGTEPLAIFAIDPSNQQEVLVRVHDACFTSEVMGSQKCDCREQLDIALEKIKKGGLIIYLQQEGRGIGLANKIAAYALQEQGLDTLDANLALHLPGDSRTYEAAAGILNDMKIKKIRLMTNNPRKISALENLGITVCEQVPIVAIPNPHNSKYMDTKKNRMGHLLDSSKK